MSLRLFATPLAPITTRPLKKLRWSARYAQAIYLVVDDAVEVEVVELSVVLFFL